MYVEVSVDEADIGSVRIGQPVDIRVDAFRRERFKGKVSRIDPQAVLEQNVTVIKVRVEIEKPDPRLKPGMNATCEFLVARKNDVVAIPNEAVNETPQGAFVEVMVNGQPQRREVKVGLQGNTKTEIIDGLQPGEVVVTGRIFNRQDEGPGSPFGRPFGPRWGGSSPRGGGQGGGGQGGPPGGGGR